MSKIDVPIPQAPGAHVEYEVDGDRIQTTLFFADIKIASETFEATAANEQGFGYAKYEKKELGFDFTFEIWIRWQDRKIVLVVLYNSPIGKGKKEAWGDF